LQRRRFIRQEEEKHFEVDLKRVIEEEKRETERRKREEEKGERERERKMEGNRERGAIRENEPQIGSKGKGKEKGREKEEDVNDQRVAMSNLPREPAEGMKCLHKELRYIYYFLYERNGKD